MTSQSGRPASPFGVRLRRWWHHRGLSQLSLAAMARSTARHISLLETGRSRPSRQMVLRLSDVLGVGLRGANELLHAAGSSGSRLGRHRGPPEHHPALH